MSRSWILQFNPNNLEHKHYSLSKLKEAIERGEEVWDINQHAKEIEKDDVALIFKTGEDNGIYAFARFANQPHQDENGDFIAEINFEKNISKFLVENPILMNKLDKLN